MRNVSPTVYTSLLFPEEEPELVLNEITNISGFLSELQPGALVLIKPNFVAPFPKATTDLRFIEFFIHAVKKAGLIPVVGEMSGYEFDTEDTLKVLGVRSFLQKLNVEFVNFEKENYKAINLCDGLPNVEIAEIVFKADLIINLPVLKGHTITKITGATKNLFGFLSRNSRQRLHCKGLNKGITELAKVFPNILHVVDARNLLSRAVFGESKPLNYCLSGTNPFAIDHYGSKLLGVNPSSVAYLPEKIDYDIVGPIHNCVTLSNKSSCKERFHRFLYSCFYYFDFLKCKYIGGSSIIPSFHWYLGVHPDVSKVQAESLPNVAKICPVNAISVSQKRVIKNKCIKVRCLRCYYFDPTGKVLLKGLNPPPKKT